MSANGATLSTESSNDATKESPVPATSGAASTGSESKPSSTPKASTGGAAGKPKFQIGDLVWAKMKGFSPWPGKVVAPNETTLKKPPGNLRGKTAHVIFFFGSNNYVSVYTPPVMTIPSKYQNAMLTHHIISNILGLDPRRCYPTL